MVVLCASVDDVPVDSV